MGESTAIDLNELGRLICAELDDSMEYVNSSMPQSSGFHVASIRVRLGQGSTEPELADDESTTPAKKNFLLDRRYPLAERGWEFEIDIAAGAPAVKLRVADKPPVILPIKSRATAADLFGELPISAIKGVDEAWSRIFREAGVERISELMSMKDETLENLIRQTNRKYPLSVRTKARLLHSAVPLIPASAADRQTLYALLGKSPEALRNLIGARHFSVTASEGLSALLALLYTLLDGRILKDFTVYDLRNLAIGNPPAGTAVDGQ